MNFSTLFRIGENLNLDRKTLIYLRWIAIIGQLIAVNFVFFLFKIRFSDFINTHCYINRANNKFISPISY